MQLFRQLFKRVRGEIGRVSRFFFVGVVATGVHLGTVTILISRNHWHPISANLIAFMTAFCISFVGHHFWTFKASGDLRASAGRFLVVSCTALIMNTGVLAVLMRASPLPHEISAGLAVGVVPVFTYILGRQWAFRVESTGKT